MRWARKDAAVIALKGAAPFDRSIENRCRQAAERQCWSRRIRTALPEWAGKDLNEWQDVPVAAIELKSAGRRLRHVSSAMSFNSCPHDAIKDYRWVMSN